MWRGTAFTAGVLLTFVAMNPDGSTPWWWFSTLAMVLASVCIHNALDDLKYVIKARWSRPVTTESIKEAYRVGYLHSVKDYHTLKPNGAIDIDQDAHEAGLRAVAALYGGPK